MLNVEFTSFVSQLSMIAGPVVDTFGPGLLVASPVGVVLLWVANNWRRRANDRLAEMHFIQGWADVERTGFGSQIADQARIIANQSDRLNRIITEARKDTRRSSARRILRIAEGVE